MPRYQCPECEAILSRKDAVGEGKKIKCPKCEFIFKAKALDGPSKEKEHVKASEKKAGGVADEEDEGGSYTVVKETEEEGGDARKKDLYFGSLRDKFPKSKRGPAMAETVQPSNLILLQGLIDCLGGLALVIIGLWPFIFSEAPPSGSAARNKILIVVGGVLLFAMGCFVCYGASKLQSLESYNWAMVGCILSIISVAPTGAAGGIWGIILLKDQKIIDGFEETASKTEG